VFTAAASKAGIKPAPEGSIKESMDSTVLRQNASSKSLFAEGCGYLQVALATIT
jgi:hypothetical protein